MLRKFKRFTPLNVRKVLAETLVLSKITYCNTVYAELPNYLLNRLQRVQNTTAGYVLGKYAKMHDVVKGLNWLPILENIEHATVKLTYLALNDNKWPDYLPIELESARRSSRFDNTMKVSRGEPHSFRQQALIFNDLPRAVRCSTSYASFKRASRNFFMDKALTRSLSS